MKSKTLSLFVCSQSTIFVKLRARYPRPLQCLFLVVCFLTAGGVIRAAHADDGFEKLRAGVSTFTLDNGLRVVFYRRDNAPVFSAQLVVRVGGVNEELGRTGIAHFLEHMAFKGTKTIGTKDYAAEEPLLSAYEKLVTESPDQYAALASPEAREISSQLSNLWVDNEFGRLYSLAGESGLNAQTAKDYTAYNLSLPTNAFEFWCWMESDRLMNPVFRQFYKEREVVQEERRSNFEDDPGGRLYEKLLDLAYTVHPYKYPNIGYSVDLKKLTATEMRDFYNRYYRPDNMVIALVGNLQLNDVKKLVNKYFGRMPSGNGKVPDVTAIEPEQTEPRQGEVIFDAEPQVFIGYHKPSYPDPDDARLAVLHTYLSEGGSSLFERELVRRQKKAVSVFTLEAPGERFPSLFITGGAPAPGVSTQELADNVQNIFDSFKAADISQSEIESARRRVRVGFLGSMDSDEELAFMLAKTELFYGDWRKIFEFYDTMTATTTQDLERIVHKYLTRNNRTLVSIHREGSK